MIRLIINTFNMKGYNNIVTTDNKYYLNDVDKIGLVEYYPNFLKTKKADSLYQYMKEIYHGNTVFIKCLEKILKHHGYYGR